MNRTSPLSLLLVPALLLAGCGQADDDTQRDGKYTAPKAAASESPSAVPSAKPGECLYTKDGSEAARKVSLPPAKPTVKKPLDMVITTNFGRIPITLTPKTGECAVNSFVSLAKQKYFDDTPCHRAAVDQGFQLLQCGDPTGSGTGGPGYVFNQQAGPDLKYPAGTLAMANTNQPNSEGSQFFLVYGDTQLPPNYTVFGTIAKPGIAVLEKIGKNGIKNPMPAGGGAPKKKVVIESVARG